MYFELFAIVLDVVSLCKSHKALTEIRAMWGRSGHSELRHAIDDVALGTAVDVSVLPDAKEQRFVRLGTWFFLTLFTFPTPLPHRIY